MTEMTWYKPILSSFFTIGFKTYAKIIPTKNGISISEAKTKKTSKNKIRNNDKYFFSNKNFLLAIILLQVLFVHHQNYCFLNYYYIFHPQI